MDMKTKNYLNSIYGRKISNELNNDDKKKLKEIYHSGETHATPIEDIRHLYPTKLISRLPKIFRLIINNMHKGGK